MVTPAPASHLLPTPQQCALRTSVPTSCSPDALPAHVPAHPLHHGAAEGLKHSVAGLHQLTEASASKITDTYEPKEEGLDVVTVDRTVPVITITLSKDPLDSSHPGYQPPLTPEEMLELGDAELESRPAQRGRGR